MALPAEAYRLTNISSKAYEHPADRAATAALASIPMLDLVVRKLIEMGYERALRQTYLGSSVRLGPDQLPRIWEAYKRALTALDMPEEYDLYLTQQPLANAATIGAGKPIIILNSATVELLDERGIEAVLGHELGHILSDHVVYRTALMILIRLEHVGAAADPRRQPAAARGALRAARMGARRRALVRPRRGADGPRPARRLLDAHGDDRRRRRRRAQPRRVRGRRWSTPRAAPASTACSGCSRTSTSTTGCRSSACTSSWRGCAAASTTASSAASTRAATSRRARRPQEAADAAAHYSDVFKGAFKEAGEHVSTAGHQLSDWLRNLQDSSAAKSNSGPGDETPPAN